MHVQRTGESMDEAQTGSAEPGRVARRPVHRGPVVDLGVDTVRFPDGSLGELEMIRHSGASAVLPLLDVDAQDPRVVLVRQYRYATGGWLYEVPAGRPQFEGEDWEVCARRELLEETGLIAGQLRPLTTIWTTPGFTDERIHLFLATELSEGQASFDADEFIERAVMPLSEALRRVESGEISDAKTLCTLLYAASFVRGTGTAG
jgi:ADP-ribose pyrophosphatase